MIVTLSVHMFSRVMLCFLGVRADVRPRVSRYRMVDLVCPGPIMFAVALAQAMTTPDSRLVLLRPPARPSPLRRVD